MSKPGKLHSVILYGSLMAFLVFVAVVLFVNCEVLYTAHDRSEFIFGSPFFHAQLSKPFGLMLPQEDPEQNMFCLKCYNRPEFMVEPVRISVDEFSRAL